jgi:formylmethanofuran--tetrahydromethanopterin N-formyltransferase
MELQGTIIEPTFAEAFGMRFTRLIITAHDEYWLQAAVHSLTGYGTSVLGCDLEIGAENWLDATETPDGRIGVSVLGFAFGEELLAKAIANRAGQCIMTCPTAALFNGLESDKQIPLGDHLRFFGDGFQKSKVVAQKRFWRIPIMEGEFICQDLCGVAKGIAGGNFIVQGTGLQITLDATRRAIAAIAGQPGAITPFPGGAVRSGSKVGSRYSKLRASTSEAFCPTLRGRVDSKLHPDAECAMEIVIDGVDQKSVSNAMSHGIRAACGNGIVAITAGNYGGKLGPYHFHLHEILT